MNQHHAAHEEMPNLSILNGALELVELAEQDRPLAEMIARCLPVLSRVVGADASAGLIVAPSRTALAPISGYLSPMSGIKCWLSKAFVHAADVTLVQHDSPRVLAGRHQREAFVRRATTFNCWSGVEMEGQTVLALLQVPALDLAHLGEAQAMLQTLTTALFKRRLAAKESRDRFGLVQTLSTMLDAIATNPDLDQVLGTIVERARELFSSDCAYLSEVDEATYRVTTRIIASVLDDDDKRRMTGLSEIFFGAVEMTRQVMHTNDYLGDPGFLHSPSTDEQVTRAGFTGIIAAPLQIGNRMLGVVGVTNRGPIDFSPEKLEIVRGLADGAAIALETTRLSSDQRRLEHQLHELHTHSANQHDVLKRSVAIQDQLTELVLQGHQVEALAHRLRQLLGNPVVVLGPFFNLLARAGLDTAEARAVISMVASARVTPRFSAEWAWMMTERKSIRLFDTTGASAAPAKVVTPVIVGAEVVGYVVSIESDTSREDLELPTLKQVATAFAVELTRARLVDEVEHRLRGDFVHDLVSGRFDPQLILGRATGLGHDLTAPQVLLALAPNAVATRAGTIPAHSPPTDHLRRVEGALRASLHQREQMAQISVVGEVIVILIALVGHLQSPRDEAITLARGIQRDLTVTLASVNVSLGLSRVCWNMESIAQAYREALLALKKGARLDEGGTLTSFDQLGVERVLLLAPEPRDLQDYAESRLGALLRYDRERGAHLVATLEAYLNSGGRLRETARTVGIHVNSLDHRLRRIEQIGEVSLDDADTRLDLALALRARRLAQPLTQTHHSVAADP